MNNEETQILNPKPQGQSNGQTATLSSTTSKTESKKSIGAGTKAAYAAGGFVAGVASAFGLNAAAAEPANDEPQGSNVAPEGNNTTNGDASDVHVHIANAGAYQTTAGQAAEPVTIPEEQEVIVYTAEGIGVAHVSDDMSFSDAFTAARAQVGPGGVFEWHGNLYNTYVQDEWSQMSVEEKANFQNSIDYEDIQGGNNEPYAGHEHTNYHGGEEPIIPAGGTYIDGDPEVNTPEIEILGVESGYTEDGQFMNVAAAEIDGHDAIFVDVDADGTMDVLGIDINENGQIDADQGEVGNIHEMGIGFDELANAVDDQNDMMAYTGNDISDYDNGADVGIMA